MIANIFEKKRNEDTFYATAKKADQEELAIEIDLVSQNDLVTGLLHSVSGILAVVNDKRQVVAFNDSFIKMLGIENPEKQLGLRPGEILHCSNAEEFPNGCGTTKECKTCGAAIAMVTSLASNRTCEKTCAISTDSGDQKIDIALNVRAHPVKIKDKKFLLLFIQDITRQQQQAALERTFFHDISNLMSMLLGASELLVDENPSSPLAGSIFRAAARLQQEISIQRYLFENETSIFKPMWNQTTYGELINDLQSLFSTHPEAQNKHLRIDDKYSDFSFITDLSLVLRVLSNMITNGLEAEENGGTVKLWGKPESDHFQLNVWNKSEIPESLRGRIFQRNFSTKGQLGRGIGTYSMKLLGEKMLGGKVFFTSSRENGTVFTFKLPLQKCMYQ